MADSVPRDKLEALASPDHNELRRLLEAAPPELFTCTPERLEQMLRDGAAAQRPQPDNLRTHDFLADAKLILAALTAFPALLAEIERLREALEPFAAFADLLSDEAPDDAALGLMCNGGIVFGPSGGACVGSLRKARAALNTPEGAGHG